MGTNDPPWKHESIDNPPDKPFWCGRKRQQSALTQPPAERVGIFTISSVSPTKGISVRSELLYPLAKWHKLSEAGVVSVTEYDDLKKTILSDIKET